MKGFKIFIYNPVQLGELNIKFLLHKICIWTSFDQNSLLIKFLKHFESFVKLKSTNRCLQFKPKALSVPKIQALSDKIFRREWLFEIDTKLLSRKRKSLITSTDSSQNILNAFEISKPCNLSNFVDKNELNSHFSGSLISQYATSLKVLARLNEFCGYNLTFSQMQSFDTSV